MERVEIIQNGNLILLDGEFYEVTGIGASHDRGIRTPHIELTKVIITKIDK